MQVHRLAAGLATLCAFAAPAIAQNKPCSNSSLQGQFGFTAQGTTLAASPVPAPLQGPFASSGMASFDGKGGFTLTSKSSFNGVIQPVSVKGTYKVNSDCAYTSQAENGVTFRSVIVDDGAEILILQTTPGVTITGIAIKEGLQRSESDDRGPSSRPLRCGNDLIRGSYGFLADGFAGPPTIPAPLKGPLVGVGTVLFDSGGSFRLVAQRSVAGVLDPQPLVLKGLYTVDRECVVKMNFEVGFTFEGTVVRGGREIDFIETDPGVTLLVKAKRM